MERKKWNMKSGAVGTLVGVFQIANAVNQVAIATSGGTTDTMHDCTRVNALMTVTELASNAEAAS